MRYVNQAIISYWIKSDISLVVFSSGSADGKLNGHLMASCVRNIHTKNYQNLITGFQVTVKKSGMLFWETQCRNIRCRFCKFFTIKMPC